MMRAFVAIDISNESVKNQIKKFQTEIDINAKPVESKNFHFTLQFLGEISHDMSQEIIQSLMAIKFSSFQIDLKGIGTFPKSKFPRIVWIGTGEKGKEMLIRLAKDVEEKLKPHGFFADKPFKPHVTVFRIKKKTGGISEKLDSTEPRFFGTQDITSIQLKKSEITPKGPVYTNLAEIKSTK